MRISFAYFPNVSQHPYMQYFNTSCHKYAKNADLGKSNPVRIGIIIFATQFPVLRKLYEIILLDLRIFAKNPYHIIMTSL